MALNFLLKRSGTASKRPTAASMALGELDLNYDVNTGGLYYKDSSGNVVKVGPCQVSATAPNVAPAGSSGNSRGEFWYDTANSTLKLYDGSTWVNVNENSGYLALTGGTMTGDITFAGTQTIPTSAIASASTSQPGVVQLNDSVSSTSTTEALTANQGYNLQQQIDALSVASNITLAGTIDASTGDLVTVTSEGTQRNFVVGQPLPSATNQNDNYFVIVTVGGTMAPPGGSAQECHQGDWWLSDGTAWNFLDVGFNATAATTSTPGIVQLATDAEVQAGTNLDHAVTSSGLQSKVSDSTSTTSSTALASSTAVKSAYDAGVQGQTDAAAAQADATQALTDASTAQSTADQAVLDAAAAQTDATNALNDASGAQSTADQAILDAAAAQSDADQALLDASAALAAANTAGTDVGNLTTLTTTDKTSAVAAINEVNAAAGAAQSDATQALSDAAAAQATADAAVPDASYTALGDILSGTGAGTYAALPLGTNGNVLTVDSTCAGGVKWAAGGGGGASPATPDTLGTVFGSTTDTPANTALGQYALYCVTTGINNTTIGKQAGVLLNSGSSNVFVGSAAGAQATTASDSVAIGALAGLLNDGCFNVAIGSGAAQAGSGGFSVVIGASAAQSAGPANVAIGSAAISNADGTASNNTVVGNSAGLCLTTGSLNVFLGNSAGGLLTTESCRLAIGYDCNLHWILGCPDLSIKPGAGIIDCAGSTGTAGQVLMSNGSNALCWGSAGGGGASIPCSLLTAKGQIVTATASSTPFALPVGTNGQSLYANSACPSGLCWGPGPSQVAFNAYPDYAGLLLGSTCCNSTQTNVMLGFCTGPSQMGATGDTGNVYIGTRSGHNLTALTTANTGLGHRTFGGCNSCYNCWNITGNTAVGWKAFACPAGDGLLYNTVVGCNAMGGAQMASGTHYNTVVGAGAAQNSLVTTRNTLLGFCAAGAMTQGCNNIAIGFMAGTRIAGFTCSFINITNEANRIIMGNVDHTCAQIQVGWTVVSDERDKAIDPQGVPYGLDFVKGINPITYCFCNRETGEIKDDKKRFGFSAQNIRALEIDTAEPVIISDDDPDHLYLTESHLIPVLVNAIKELSTKNDALEARLAALENA